MPDAAIQSLLDGSGKALAAAISLVEDESSRAEALLEAIYPHTGSAYRIGITGPPGAGKSSLVDQLITRFRQSDRRVGVISVDPTSPFTGGALLGDRLRMGRHYRDRDVFIRSMATRGHSGGLASRSQEVGDLLDAAGFGVLLFETIGVGQIELDVMEAVDTTLVVLVPESGDDIQLMKAGIIEIADVFAINKADREGAGRLASLLEQMLAMKPDAGGWQVPVEKTSATRNEGLDELYGRLLEHHAHLQESGAGRRKQEQRYRRRVESQVASQVMGKFWTPARGHLLESRLEAVSPYELARTILELD